MKFKYTSLFAPLPIFAAGRPYVSAAHALAGNLSWWQICLVGIGVLAVIAVIMDLFFEVGDEPEDRYVSELNPVDSPEFLRAISHVSNSPTGLGPETTVLKNGKEFLPALLKALGEAKESINFTAYIWEKGEMSNQVFQTLLERAGQGVEVRLLLDGFGGYSAPQEQLDKLKQAGAQIEIFRAPQLGKLTRLHRRNHRRAIIVDGLIGFTGGMAIADKWLGDAENSRQWRDTMFEVRGTMAASLQSAFAELWAGTRGEILSGRKFYPEVNGGHDTRETVPFVSLVSSPASDTQPLAKFFWLSIASAKQSVYLNSSYVVPDKHIRKALVDRAKAGVDVRLLVPNNLTDAQPIRLASHYYFMKYLKAGVKIYEYQPTMIHNKILLVDGTWSVVGSANMDMRSVALNEENVLGISSPVLGGKLKEIFFEDLKRAHEVEIKTWKKRGAWERLGEAVCVKFIKQY